MNQSEDIIKRFLEVWPDFQKAWEEHLEEWEQESPGIYLDLAALARYIVDSYEVGSTKCFAKVFNEIENFISSENLELRGLITVGLLESIQNNASHRSFGYNVFINWLGPQSKVAWEQIDTLWDGKLNLMDILKDEK